MKNNEISIICCLYNEIYIIKKKFSEVLRKLLLNFYKEILFIDNNSDDGTKEYLLNFAKNNSNSKLKFIFNKKKFRQRRFNKKSYK